MSHKCGINNKEVLLDTPFIICLLWQKCVTSYRFGSDFLDFPKIRAIKKFYGSFLAYIYKAKTAVYMRPKFSNNISKRKVYFLSRKKLPCRQRSKFISAWIIKC